MVLIEFRSEVLRIKKRARQSSYNPRREAGKQAVCHPSLDERQQSKQSVL